MLQSDEKTRNDWLTIIIDYFCESILFTIYALLFIIYYLLFIIITYYLLSTIYNILSTTYYLLLTTYYLLLTTHYSPLNTQHSTLTTQLRNSLNPSQSSHVGCLLLCTFAWILLRRYQRQYTCHLMISIRINPSSIMKRVALTIMADRQSSTALFYFGLKILKRRMFRVTILYISSSSLFLLGVPSPLSFPFFTLL